MNTFGRRLVSVASVLAILLTQCSWAQARGGRGRDRNDIDGAGSAARSDLNLRSRERLITAGQHHDFAEATLQVGRTTRTVTPGDLLTHAEHVALQQVLAGGQQSLVLGRHGNAVRGSFQLTPDISQGVHDVIVPRGVTAVTDAASALAITGNLVNAGRLYAMTSNPESSLATISAANIYNRQGAVISSILPASMTSAVNRLDLSLNAVHDIINYGLISSSGNLNLSAGGQIVNALPTGTSGPAPVIQALGNVNLASSSIVNAGVIASLTGSINIASQMAGSLLVQNTGGTMRALSGAINLGSPTVTDKINVTALGGDFLSQELNAYGGKGKVIINVEDITGLVNVYAHEAHVTALADNLRLGTIQLTGDPTFFNINPGLNGGDITISGSISTAGNALAIVATRDIIIDPGVGPAITIDSAGGTILMVAGAEATSNGPLNDTNNVNTILDITGGSASGGNISVVGGTSIKSNANTAGTITLVAFAGSLGDRGNITVDSSSGIESKGSGLNSNGNVTMIAGGSTGITVSTIDSTGGTKAGAVSAILATPTVTGGSVQIQNGAIINGGSFAPGTAGSGSFHSTGTIQALDSFQVVTGSGDVTLDGAVLANTVVLLAGSASTITVGNVNGGANTGIFSTGSDADGDVIGLRAGTIVIPFAASVQSGTGPLTDVPITFLASQVLNDGFISSNNDINFQSFDGQSSLVVDGKSGQVFTQGFVNLTSISDSLSFTQAAIFATFHASTLQLHDYFFNNTSFNQGGLTIDSLTTDHVTGSTITLLASGDVSVLTLDATGTGANSGGTITVNAQNFEAAGSINGVNSVDASATGTGDGGTISIRTFSNNPFEVCGATVNSTNAHVAADGVNGGSVTLDNAGGQIVHAGCSVSANGTTGQGGTVFLTGTSPLTVTVDGTVSATNNANNSGTVAISGGPNGVVTVNGTGIIQAGKSVKVGNVNPTTLKFASPKASAVNIDPNLTIGNKLALGGGGAPVLVASATVAPGSLAALPLAPPPPVATQQQVAGGQAIQKVATDQTPVDQGTSYSLASKVPVTTPIPLSQVIVATEIETENFDAAFVSALATQAPGLVLGSQTAGNYIELERGNALFTPHDDIIVKLVEGYVFIAGGSHVLIMETGVDQTGADPYKGESAVYDLHDLYKGAVRVVANKKEIVLTPGKQVVLTKKLDAKFEDVNPGTRIAYRNVRSEDVGGGIKAFAADFSIPSAMTRVDPLRRYLATRQGKNRAVANQLLKNAVLMANMPGASEPYKSGP